MGARLTTGRAVRPDLATGHAIGAWIFPRILGACLAVSFFGLWQQSPGLLGEHGIAPLSQQLEALRAEHGTSAYWRAPTLLWLVPSLAGARALALIGLACSLSLALGFAQRIACAVAFGCYLAFTALEQHGWFLFNWPHDELQLETAFMTIALVPGAWRAPWSERAEPPRIARWLLLWCTVRLFLGCGITKWMAGQSSWLDGTATHAFLETMPSPRPEAAWLHAAPAWLHAASCYGTFGYELVGPVLFLVPGRARRGSALVGIALMAGVWVVGNFRGLPILSAALLMLLIDDRAWERVLPRGWLAGERASPQPQRRRFAALLAVPVLLASTAATLEQLGVELVRRTPWLASVARPATALHVGNAYSMFCIVPPRRETLVLEGTLDGIEWRAYQPRGNCARVDRAPSRHAPHHDYLGFLLWLGGLSPAQFSARFAPALQRGLLERRGEVEALFAELPFDGAPVRAVRCVKYVFSYASAEERARGVYWCREPRELVLAPLESVARREP